MGRSRVLYGLGACWLSLAPSAAAQIRLACVGDSITEGYGLAAPAQEAYPSQLGAILGSDYDVRNFGVSGATARKQGDKPYWNQPAYTQSTTFAPEVVLLMLGTNDAKPQNWDEPAFTADYTALVEQYRGLGARVLVATPPKVFANGAFDISPSTVEDQLAPLVRRLALRVGAELVDIFATTQEHPEWFPDTVHPSREGAAAIAASFAAEVQGTPRTEAPSSAPSATDDLVSSQTQGEVTELPSSAVTDTTRSVYPSELQSTGTLETATTSADPAPASSPASGPAGLLPPTPSSSPPSVAAPSSVPPATSTALPPSSATSVPSPPSSPPESGCRVVIDGSAGSCTVGAGLGFALALWSARRRRSLPVQAP